MDPDQKHGHRFNQSSSTLSREENHVLLKAIGKMQQVAVSEERQVPLARKRALTMAEHLEFRPVEIGHIVTAVSELANNLVFHTQQGGLILIQAVFRGVASGIEIVAVDDGPGILDIDLALKDGYSTNSGLGGGLPGVKRLMDELEIISQYGQGTRITARKWKISKSTYEPRR